MKRLLLALGIILLMACATSPALKYEAGPSLADRQEKVLAQTKLNQETEIFEMWWAQEKIRFGMYMSSSAGHDLFLELKEVKFIHKYRVSAAHVRMTSAVDEGDLYIVATRPFGVWEISQVTIGDVTLLQKETGAENNDEQL